MGVQVGGKRKAAGNGVWVISMWYGRACGTGGPVGWDGTRKGSFHTQCSTVHAWQRVVYRYYETGGVYRYCTVQLHDVTRAVKLYVPHGPALYSVCRTAPCRTTHLAVGLRQGLRDGGDGAVAAGVARNQNLREQKHIYFISFSMKKIFVALGRGDDGAVAAGVARNQHLRAQKPFDSPNYHHSINLQRDYFYICDRQGR